MGSHSSNNWYQSNLTRNLQEDQSTLRVGTGPIELGLGGEWQRSSQEDPEIMGRTSSKPLRVTLRLRVSNVEDATRHRDDSLEERAQDNIELDMGSHSSNSLFSRANTQVIYIDPKTGILMYNGKLVLDHFKSEREAVDYITNRSRGFLPRSSLYGRVINQLCCVGELWDASCRNKQLTRR
ncbi:hypothetical protein F2Q70_00044507 [Brassica cretica]|uniref:Uncharacterized protein n=1 Tax=Brassica cretica TaxID=69181 RepID=A0A8S9KIP9_BRACR|nr:hypothetical protein F2Q70_00044507 [Brassica cretica]